MEDQSSADDHKILGNQEFKEGNYHAAISHYTDAIAENESEVYYSNRAASYVCLKKYKEARKDSIRAIEINPEFLKAVRRYF